MTMNPGINYASLTPTINRDVKAGIRYGVIPLNEVCQAWCDSSQTEYPSEYEVDCPECGLTQMVKADADAPVCEDSDCKADISKELEFACENSEPISEFIDDGEYKATADSQGDIFIIKSPYFTYAQFCSPCAPGACYLENPLDEPIPDNKCYAFGHDWFEERKAPYPVYSVETGLLVSPEKEAG